jgi:hypothetical protein
MTAHKPTPWHHNSSLTILSGRNTHIATMAPETRVSKEEMLANRDFIIKACNAHDELVAAVKAFLAYDADDHSDGVGVMLNYNDALVKAKAAIAKVEA